MTKEELTQLITKGIIARNAIRKLVRNGQGPKTKVPALLDFQKAEGTLDADSYYGPNSEAALRFYLSKLTDNDVPKSHEAYSKVPATWKPPSDLVDKAVEAKPVVAEKPKTSTPIVKKKTTPKKKEATKKLVITAAGLKAVAGLNKALTKEKNKKKQAAKAIAEDTPKFGQEKTNGDFDAEEMMAASIADPLDEIKRLLLEEEQQNQATFEHNNIVKQNKTNEEILTTLRDVQNSIKKIKYNSLANLGLFV